MIPTITMKSMMTKSKLLNALKDRKRESTTSLSPSFLLMTLSGLSALIALNALRLLRDEPYVSLDSVVCVMKKSSRLVVTTSISRIFHPLLI